MSEQGKGTATPPVVKVVKGKKGKRKGIGQDYGLDLGKMESSFMDALGMRGSKTKEPVTPIMESLEKVEPGKKKAKKKIRDKDSEPSLEDMADSFNKALNEGMGFGEEDEEEVEEDDDDEDEEEDEDE